MTKEVSDGLPCFVDCASMAVKTSHECSLKFPVMAKIQNRHIQENMQEKLTTVNNVYNVHTLYNDNGTVTVGRCIKYNPFGRRIYMNIPFHMQH